MKRLFLSALLAISLFFTSCGQLKVFKGADSIPGVETVYVGGALLRIGMNSAGAEYADMGKEYGVDVSGLEAIEILDTETPAAIAKLKPFVDRVVKEKKFEVAMQNKEDGELNTIYFSPQDAKQRSDMLIVSQEKDEMSVVLLQGITFKAEKKQQ